MRALRRRRRVGRHWRDKQVRDTGPRVAHVLVAAASGLGIAALVGGPIGLLLGAGVAAGAWGWLRRQPSPTQRAERRRLASDLPYAADLLAAVLRAGAPPDTATQAVGSAIDGPLGDRLSRVGRALRLGASPTEAWSRLAGPDDEGPAGSLARAAVRSHGSGAALAATFTRLGEELRAARLASAEAAARRAGVLIVLPLGLCFLPAFVLAGLLPVIVAVLGDVLPQ